MSFGRVFLGILDSYRSLITTVSVLAITYQKQCNFSGGTGTVKITFMFQRDCESNAILGDGAEGILQGTRTPNLSALFKLL